MDDHTPDYNPDGTTPGWDGPRAAKERHARRHRDANPPPPHHTPPPTAGHHHGPNGAAEAAYVEAALDKEVHTLLGATTGTRNDVLNIAAFNLGTLLGNYPLTAERVETTLTPVAQSIGLGPSEIAKTIHSGLSKGLERPRPPLPPRVNGARVTTRGAGPAGTSQTAADPAGTAERAPTASVPPPPDDDEFWDARTSLTRVRDFARARRSPPWGVLGTALARVIVATPPNVVLPALSGDQASLNLFIALCAGSGEGKGTSTRAGTAALHLDEPITVMPIGSGEGLAHLYAKRAKGELVRHTQALLLDVPEVDTLTALRQRQGSTLLPELRKAWMGEPLGFSYADADKRLPIQAHTYRLAMLVGVQPQHAADILADVTAGTPQRFLWLPAYDIGAPDVRPAPVPPLHWTAPLWRTGVTRDGQIEMRVCASAEEHLDALRVAGLRRESRDPLDAHAGLVRLKTAAALALLDGRVNVDDEDWHLAGMIMAVSDQQRAQIRAELVEAGRRKVRARAVDDAAHDDIVADRAEEIATRRITRRVLEYLGEGPSTRRNLSRKISGRDRQYLDQVLEQLVDKGSIQQVETISDINGRQGMEYQL